MTLKFSSAHNPSTTARAEIFASPSTATKRTLLSLTLLAASLVSGSAMLAQSSGAAPQPNSGGGLKFISNPGGGDVVYGSLTGASSLPNAMGIMLREVHGHYGDRPQIGKFFQSKSGDSVATFFTVTAKNQGGKPIAGLVIVSQPQGGQMAAAVLTDEANRFGKTEGALMAKLNEAWNKENAASVKPASVDRSSPAQGGGNTQRPGPVPQLHSVSASDNSGSIGVPAGWRLTDGGGGFISVAGPNGEEISLGGLIQNIYDPQNPKARGMIQYMSMSKQPPIQCPLGNDLVQDYLCVVNQSLQQHHKSPVSLTVTQRQTVPGNQYTPHAMIVNGDMDRHDGKGMMSVVLQIGVSAMNPQGGWNLSLSAEVVPKQIADQEWPTIRAIAASFRGNSSVVIAENGHVSDQIHQTAIANNILIKSRSDANDAHNAQVNAQWDEQARQNKAFENYTLDRSVVSVTDLNAHGTFTNPTADWLVQTNPDRFQIVQSSNYLKGIDY